MNDNVFNSLNNLMYENQIGNLPTLVSQIGSVHSVSAMAKKLMEIECSPSLSAIEKSLSHSTIVDRLEEGTIIRIAGKYRKWRQIIWQNEEEELCMGWIQNYKLDKFKSPRKAQTGKSRKL